MKTFFAALMTYTRLPLPSQGLDARHFSASLTYLPLVGLLVGLLAASIYWLSSYFFASHLAAFFALAASVLITGALHEDGFADCCDGFGASQEKQRILAIMKDSSNGSYAQLGLTFLILAKILLLFSIAAEHQASALIFMHALARFSPLLIVLNTPHCQAQHSKMSANLHIDQKTLMLISAAIFMLSLSVLSLWLTVLLIIALLFLCWVCRWFFIKRLDGYNGDALGASEQLSECLVLLLFAAYF